MLWLGVESNHWHIAVQTNALPAELPEVPEEPLTPEVPLEPDEPDVPEDPSTPEVPAHR